MRPRKIIPIDIEMDVPMAFYRSIGYWAEAVETGQTEEANLQLRKLEVLGRKMAEGESFQSRFEATKSKYEALEMLDCLCGYLEVLTRVAPSRVARPETAAEEHG